MKEFARHYLLDKKVIVCQPEDAYRASSDAVWLAAALKDIRNGAKILDVGAGTGAVSLCLASRFKDKGCHITGIELQPLLAEAAAMSAKANGFDFVEFIRGNIFETRLEPCSFDHVITNPPYALSDMPSPNDSKAAAHNFQFENLERWLDFCIKMLKPKGCFYIINRAEALEDIVAHLHGRLGRIEVIPLYSKSGQPAKRVIIRAQKDSKAPLVLCPPVEVHEADGCYSPKAEDVLRRGGAI